MSIPGCPKCRMSDWTSSHSSKAFRTLAYFCSTSLIVFPDCALSFKGFTPYNTQKRRYKELQCWDHGLPCIQYKQVGPNQQAQTTHALFPTLLHTFAICNVYKLTRHTYAAIKLK